MREIFSIGPTEKDVGELTTTAFTYGANDRTTKAIKDFFIVSIHNYFLHFTCILFIHVSNV